MRVLLAALLLMSTSGCLRFYHEAAHHERNCKTSAESWDAILLCGTIGAPVLWLEILTFVPYMFDQIWADNHDRTHHLGRYKPRKSR